MKILAIDYGRKRVGLAISYATLAEPYKILLFSPQIFTQIKQICDQEMIEKVVVGLSEAQMAQETKQFAKKLQNVIVQPITFVDETLSTQLAEKKVRESNMKRSKKIAAKDHFAAAEFLQDYLDSLH